ncbi:MAG: EAL domain-containing protein [Methylococcaceae bacterium]|nr:EAL domain-containing protein [Methylococcaceae bacterium]MDD1610303.1 EAL domain-containing protein [Methylococcaceae bacterium]MDD1616941.1 EAL domain-containing protein [Methylococcaceae bacterium]OYV16433.1 MAG: diguanylate cyclase [Methylococcaceae bacterium NSP1-2]
MEFFYQQLVLQPILDKSYNPYLVILSIIIAIISAFTALGVSERLSVSKTKTQQLLWILFGASTMGTGIWAMHFIGLLALILPVPVSYNLTITIISVFPAIFASGLVLWLKNKASANMTRLLFCGVLLGGGIGIMHYVGMMAMEVNAGMYHIKSLFMLSLLVAMLLATVALKIQSKTSHRLIYSFIDKKQAYSAIVMGLAVSGMHYTAMEATVFVQATNNHPPETAINAVLLAMMISIVMLLSLSLAIMTPLMLRYKQMLRELAQNEEALRIAATTFQTHEAIMITDGHANIVRVNQAFVNTTGFTEAEVLGKNPRLLSSGKHNIIFYKNIWSSIISTGKWNGEIWNRRKNGEIFLEWQTISAVKNIKGVITHYVSFFSDITDLKSSKQAVEKLAYYDPLTNLPNRRLLYERLKNELAIAKKYQRIGALLFMDLDRFKNINDSLGHSVGDALLVEVAHRLQAILSNDATAIRLGGDEFIVLIAAQDETAHKLIDHAQTIAENMITQIGLPYLVVEHDLYISPSIGITLYTGDDNCVDLILKRADTAMYHAKDAGRNTYRFYQQRMQELADARLTLEKNLRKAIEKDELSVRYQPQSSFTGEIIGAEALIRWCHSKQGMISPSEFIPIAEETGLIIEIGSWVIENVCQQINEWDLMGIVVPHIAVNISPKQFHQADFVSVVIRIIESHKIKPNRVLLEITEGVFLKNIEEAIIKMNVLRKYGFSFSIDDFGTGYSSLSYLKRLPFDQLKIDQSFTNDLINNPHSAAIVQAIIVMAEGLGLSLIAEGVETNKQLNCLSDYGCHFFQGYYFSKPLLPEPFADYFLNKLISSAGVQ